MSSPILLDRSIPLSDARLHRRRERRRKDPSSMGLMLAMLLQLLRSHRLEDGSDLTTAAAVGPHRSQRRPRAVSYRTPRGPCATLDRESGATDGSTIERAGEFLFFTLEKGSCL